MLDQLLVDARGGGSGALVIRGEAGVGKTALLRYCVQHAADCEIVDVAGVEDELDLPFAALHQLCQPLLDHVSDLPEPQARALRVAFGFAAGSTPDRLMVGLAVLTLLSEAAATRPLVCVVDDAQWVDEASAQVLGVVARRLLAESVVLLFAVRDPGGQHRFDGLRTLTLDGLTTDDARKLLVAATASHVDAQVRDRIVAETRGNPLALLELSHAMSAAELAGGFATPTSATDSNQIEQHYAQRIRVLPRPAQMVMMLAAADPTGDPALVWRAVLGLGLDADAATVAASDQLLVIDSQVRFRHPLARSAAYAAGSDADRRAAHAALAAATDAQADLDRRAWHLALAAASPDEALAVELERLAARAQARGGVAAAAAVLQRAVRLTAVPARRFDRALTAASAHLHAGSFDDARRLLAEAAGAASGDLQQARVEQLRAQIAAASNPVSDASLLLLNAAARLEVLDVGLARETYLHAWLAATVAGRSARSGGTLREVSRAALACPPPTNEPRPSDLLLDALAMSTISDRRTAAPSLKRAMHTFLDGEVTDDEALTRGMLACLTAMGLWDMQSWDSLSTRQIELARARGAFSPLVITLEGHAVMLALRGDFDEVSAFAQQAMTLADVTGVRFPSFGGLLVAGYRGRPSEAEALFAATKTDSRAAGHWIGWASAILNNALGRYAEAYDGAATAATSEDGPFTPSWALPELVEAAVRSGQTVRAEEALEQLEAAAVDESDWAMGVVARSQALLRTGAPAESSFQESVARLSRSLLRLDLARSRLLYGEWLRRQGRRVDARVQLRAAHSSFEAMGAEAFADRARRELLATGERVRKRAAGTSNSLTPQELQIARLARAGGTNPEIAAQLFLSSRTVEWHLRKVFAKLGITARGELRDALPSSLPATTPG